MYFPPSSSVLRYSIFVSIFMWLVSGSEKVNRWLARYSPRATTTNQPTNGAPNEPARPGSKWPKMHILDQIWSFLGKKTLILTGEIKSFVTHITENPPRHLVCIVFWSGMGRNGPKMPIIGPKWPEMHILDQIWPFWAKSPNSSGRKQKFWYLRNRKIT